MRPPKVLVFDLMGTILDVSALDPLFRQYFGSSHLRREWFSEALKTAFAITASGEYVPFSDITESALKEMEERYDRRLSWLTRRRILKSMRSLPSFPDVEPALRRLRSQRVRLAILTNSGKSAAQEALKDAGLERYFEAVLSADQAKRLKPAPEPYRMAAKKLGLKPKQLMLVAAHAWDVSGATRAGVQTCFVSRPGQVLNELTPKPNRVISDFDELVSHVALAA
jgi:2-haloacid dehalogenase